MPDGNPVSGATIRPGLKPGGDFSLSLPQIASGSDGRFTVAQRADRMRLFAGGRKRGKDHPAAVRIQGCRRPAGRNHGRRRHQIEGLTTTRSSVVAFVSGVVAVKVRRKSLIYPSTECVSAGTTSYCHRGFAALRCHA